MYKITRVYTLPDNADVTHFSESATFREWFEENWAGGGRHIRTDSYISDDGKTMTKEVYFADKDSFVSFTQQPEVVAATKERNDYNTRNNISHSVTFEEVADEE